MASTAAAPSSPFEPVFSIGCPQELKDPQMAVGDFKVIKVLGQQIVSMVLLVEHKSGVKCALKAYDKSKLSDLNHFQIRREVDIHSRLNHKHVVNM
jgi:serine/threonine protein kinase